jgi:hypothetical protein
VLEFRRVVALTSIDPGALRGDLAERLLLADLQRIDESQRRTEEALDQDYRSLKPYLFGALLDLVASVLAELPNVRLGRLPRMADFGQIVAALDATTGHRALATYTAQFGRVALDVLEADPVGASVVEFMSRRSEWIGTAGQLFDEITADKPPRGWPKSASGMARQLRRLVEPLRAVNIIVEPPPANDKTRKYRVSNAQTAQPPEVPSGDAENDDDGWAVDENEPPNRPVNRPAQNTLGATKDPIWGGSGGMGGSSPTKSKSCRDAVDSRDHRAAVDTHLELAQGPTDSELPGMAGPDLRAWE